MTFWRRTVHLPSCRRCNYFWIILLFRHCERINYNDKRLAWQSNFDRIFSALSVMMRWLAFLCILLLQDETFGFHIKVVKNSLTHQDITERAIFKVTLETCRTSVQNVKLPVRIIWSNVRNLFLYLLFLEYCIITLLLLCVCVCSLNHTLLFQLPLHVEPKSLPKISNGLLRWSNGQMWELTSYFSGMAATTLIQRNLRREKISLPKV